MNKQFKKSYKIEIVRQKLNNRVRMMRSNMLDEGVVALSQYLDELIADYVGGTGGCSVERDNFEISFDEIIDLFPIALCVVKELVIIDCNKMALELFGYSMKQDMIGLLHEEISPQYQPDEMRSDCKIKKIIKDAINNKNQIIYQWKYQRNNGDYFLSDIQMYMLNNIQYLFFNSFSMMGQAIAPTMGMGYTYRNMFEHHNSVMLLIEPSTGLIIEANDAAVMYYGYSKDVLLTMRIQEINMLSQSQTEAEMQLAKTEKRNFFQFVHKLANNELREVEVYSYPIKSEKGTLLFSIIHDASEKNRQKLMFNTLFLDSPYSVIIMDSERRVVNINKNFTELFQYTLDEIRGEYVQDLVSMEENKGQVNQNIQDIYRGIVLKQEGQRRRKDGQRVDVEIICYPVTSMNKMIGAYVIYIDISERIANEKQLQLFKKALENSTEGVVITDVVGRTEWINQAFYEITGYTLPEIAGKGMNILKSGIQNESFYKEMWSQLKLNGIWRGEIWNKNKRGDIYSEWLTINSIQADYGKTSHYVGVFKDLSEKKKLDIRMNDLQQKDLLTGLFNRNYFCQAVDASIRNSCAASFYICSIGVEGVKEIDDSLGHNFAEQLMIELSDRLTKAMGEDCLLSRCDTDEFAVFCSDRNNKVEMKTYARTLLETIKRPYIINDTTLYINIYIGISDYPDSAADAKTLIRFADIAMSKAKNQTEDNICFYTFEMSKDIEMKFLLTNQLIRALHRNELYLCYQPIFNLKAQDKMDCAEALLRWENPLLGKIPPDQFIPLAERTGQILEIGEWVLEQVCRQISVWRMAGYQIVPIAVNLSVKQLEQMEFADRVMDILRKYQVNTEEIELEITESVSLGDITAITMNLKRLKREGFRISMDDFGTGFSSLGQLDLFELDKLKIDKVFIDDLTGISKRQNLVKTIISMANNLELKVVAEGIETKEQLYYLKEIGCDLGQGFLLERPVIAGEIEKYFKYTRQNRV